MRRVRSIAHQDAAVRRGQRIARRQLAFAKEHVDLFAVELEIDDAARQPIELDPLILVGLRDHSERIGADAEVRVHRDEHGDVAAVVLADVERGLQDGLIHGRVVDGAGQREPLARYGDAKRTARVESDPLGERSPALPKLVEQPGDRASVPAALGPLALELIDFFDHVDGDDDVVVLEPENGVRVVK